MFEETMPPAEPTLGATLPGDIHSGVPKIGKMGYTGDERLSEELNEAEETKMDLMAAINNKYAEAMADADDDLF